MVVGDRVYRPAGCGPDDACAADALRGQDLEIALPNPVVQDSQPQTRRPMTGDEAEELIPATIERNGQDPISPRMGTAVNKTVLWMQEGSDR
jgi:hypothetical protein